MKIECKKVKICVTIPVNDVEKVRNAVCEVGAGVIGNYTYCTTSVKSIGTFKPNESANPYIGTKNNLEFVEEEKLEFVCDIYRVKQVIKELKFVHPYEEPAIDIIPLLDEDAFKGVDMKNYFIIHGTFGHNQENWFPWLEQELKARGFEVFNLNYPTPDEQNFENWSNVLNRYKDKITEDTVFICHNIGCVFLAKYCIYNKIKIGKAIFVSGCNNYYFLPQFDEINRYMYTDRILEFKNYCKDVICFMSKDDPYITFDELQKFAYSVNGKMIVKENSGHFNEKAGYKTFPELLKYV